MHKDLQYSAESARIKRKTLGDDGVIAQRLSQFFSGLLDAAWVIELLLNVLAWVILCWNGKKKKVLIPASIGLLLVKAAGGIGLFGLIGMNNAYPLLFKLLKGAVFYLFLCLFSGYQRKTRIVLEALVLIPWLLKKKKAAAQK